MSTESPDLPDANGTGNTEWTCREKSRVNLAFPAVLLGLFGLYLDYLGSGWGIEFGNTNILYYFGGLFMSLAILLAIATIKGRSKGGRVVAICILAVTAIPTLTFWTALPTLLNQQG